MLDELFERCVDQLVIIPRWPPVEVRGYAAHEMFKILRAEVLFGIKLVDLAPGDFAAAWGDRWVHVSLNSLRIWSGCLSRVAQGGVCSPTMTSIPGSTIEYFVSK